MLKGQIGRYERRIAEEEKLAGEATSPDLALAHRQVAMLYRTEVAIIRKTRAISVGEELTKLG